MTRRWALILAGLATVALLLAMAPADDRMRDTGGPGIVPFELTGGEERADEIRAEWGEKGEDAARESLWIDFGFLVAYGALLTLLLAATRDLAQRRGWPRLTAAGRFAVYFGAIAAGFDALENTCLLITLGDRGSAFPLLATVFAGLKFAFLAAALAYLLAGLATRLLGGRAVAA